MALSFSFSQTPVSAGTFDAQISFGEADWRSIVQDEVITVVAPAPIRVKVNSIADWATDDLRQIFIETDFGERYTLASHSDADIPTTLRKLGGSTAGKYQGPVCGHAARGTDLSGNQVLTSTYDPGGGRPVGTYDLTLEVYVSDGLSSDTITCTIRLVHPDVYHADADGSDFALKANGETRRWGTIYVSRDGDFTGAPAKRAPTTTLGGIAHVHIPSGEFSVFRFTRNALTNDYGNAGWGSSGYPECVQVLFKSGEEYYPTISFNPGSLGRNSTFGTWYPAGETAPAIWDATGADLLTYHPNPEPPGYSSTRRGMVNSNALSGSSYGGWRFVNLHLRVSNYDPSAEASREWWNILKYTGTGGFAENTNTDNSLGFTGDIITDGSGNYSQVIADDGAGTIIARQVVTNVDTAGGVTQAKIDAPTVTASTFADGATLSNLGSTVSVTFVAAGSRQDRVVRTPCAGFDAKDVAGILIDRCRVSGASSGLDGLGNNSVISDSVFANCWNYAVTKTAGGATTDMSETGVIAVQPLGYSGVPRFFGTGESVSDNRNFFNATYSRSGEANVPAENNVSHSMRRFARFRDYSMHLCGGRWYGGHGSAHQPALRMGTDGTSAEGIVSFVMHGCFFTGGDVVMQSAMANLIGVPYTPKFWIMERCHFRADFSTSLQPLKMVYSNFTLRNCLVEYPAIDVAIGASGDVGFIRALGSGPFYATQADYDAVPKVETDPDVNAVSPVIEFNTFIFQATNATGRAVLSELASHRGVAWTHRNNAYGIDSATVASIDAGVSSQNDDPKLASGFFNADFRPLAGSRAYQSATGFIPAQDAAGAARPSSNASKGYREPA